MKNTEPYTIEDWTFTDLVGPFGAYRAIQVQPTGCYGHIEVNIRSERDPETEEIKKWTIFATNRLGSSSSVIEDSPTLMRNLSAAALAAADLVEHLQANIELLDDAYKLARKIHKAERAKAKADQEAREAADAALGEEAAAELMKAAEFQAGHAGGTTVNIAGYKRGEAFKHRILVDRTGGRTRWFYDQEIMARKKLLAKLAEFSTRTHIV